MSDEFEPPGGGEPGTGVEPPRFGVPYPPQPSEDERRRRSALTGSGVVLGIPVGIVAGLVAGLFAMGMLSGAGLRREAHTKIGMLVVTAVFAVTGVGLFTRAQHFTHAFLKGLAIGGSVGLLLSTACWGVVSLTA